MDTGEIALLGQRKTPTADQYVAETLVNLLRQQRRIHTPRPPSKPLEIEASILRPTVSIPALRDMMLPSFYRTQRSLFFFGSHVMAEKIVTREADYYPLCPHCNNEIREVHWRQMPATNAEYIFNCPQCRKVIGVGVRKAAWIS